MRFGAKTAGWGIRRLQELEITLAEYTVVHTDDLLVNRWGIVRAKTLKIGRHIDLADAWIAATALEFDIPLVTHNARDFSFVEGLVLITEKEV